MKFRAAVATAAVVPLALGLAACGDKKPAAAPPAPVPVPTTVEAQKAVATTPPPVVRLNRATFVPAMNAALAKQKSWRTSLQLQVRYQTVLTSEGVQTFKPAAMSLTMSGAAFKGKTAKIIFVKGNGYASIPGVTPAGKYAKFKSGKVAQLDQLLENGDPTRTFKSFDKALVSVKYIGENRMAGMWMERYEVTLNTAKAFAAQGKKLPKGMPATIMYTLWMDKSHLMRRMELELDYGFTSTVMTMSDYNKPVKISPPPASKIVN
jgi:hypothetical protein